MTPEVSEAHVLSCSECEHYFCTGDDARCVACPNLLYVPMDVERYLEPGEYVVTLPGDVLAYFHTETTEHVADIESVRVQAVLIQGQAPTDGGR